MEVYKKKTAEDLKEDLNVALDEIIGVQNIIRSVDNECGIELTSYGIGLINSALKDAKFGIICTKEYLEAHQEELEPAKGDKVIIKPMEATDEQ